MSEKDDLPKRGTLVPLEDLARLHKAIDPLSLPFEEWRESFLLRWNYAIGGGAGRLQECLSPTELEGVLRYIPDVLEAQLGRVSLSAQLR